MPIQLRIIEFVAGFVVILHGYPENVLSNLMFIIFWCTVLNVWCFYYLVVQTHSVEALGERKPPR